MCSSGVLVVDISDFFGRVSDPDSLGRSREPFLISWSTDESTRPNFGNRNTTSPEIPDENSFSSIRSAAAQQSRQQKGSFLHFRH